MYDALIRDALIYDGLGGEPFKASVGIAGERIAFVGKGRKKARCVIDGNGLVLTPGFIDIHAHSEFLALREPEMSEKLLQGITSDLSGNCGIGPFPLGDGASRLKALCQDILGHAPSWSWHDFDSFTALLSSQGVGINMGFLQAHSSLRLAVMGEDCSRPATACEIERMCALLSESLSCGAFGFSSGLYYAPCCFASRDELLALLRTTASHDALFAVHHRCEGNSVLESVEEVLSLALESGVRLEISHLKAIGKGNQEKVDALLSLIDSYRDKGVDVLFDQYPYTFGSTSLFSLLPPSALALSRPELRFALAIDDQREKFREEILHGEGWDSIYELAGAENITLMSLEGQSELEGFTLSALASMRSQDPLDVLFDILSEEGGSAVMTDVTQSEENLVKIMSSPLMCFGSDALYAGEHLHPRSYSAALEFLSYSLEKHILPLEEAVRKMSSECAKRLRLEDRGVIREGAAADLVLFDCQHFRDGLSLVMVNGGICVKEGVCEGKPMGRILKSGRASTL